MSKKYHLALDVMGGIQNARMLKGCITVGGQRLLYVKDIRAFLMGELAQGHKYLPITECDHFDYQKGCLGHVIDDGGKENERNAEPPAENFDDAEDRLAEQCKRCALHDNGTDADCMDCVKLINGRWEVAGFKSI